MPDASLPRQTILRVRKARNSRTQSGNCSRVKKGATVAELSGVAIIGYKGSSNRIQHSYRFKITNQYTFVAITDWTAFGRRALH